MAVLSLSYRISPRAALRLGSLDPVMDMQMSFPDQSSTKKNPAKRLGASRRINHDTVGNTCSAWLGHLTLWFVDSGAAGSDRPPGGGLSQAVGGQVAGDQVVQWMQTFPAAGEASAMSSQGHPRSQELFFFFPILSSTPIVFHKFIFSSKMFFWSPILGQIFWYILKGNKNNPTH